MKLTKKCSLSSRTQAVKFVLPDFTDRGMIPSKISITEQVGSGDNKQTIPIRDIDCKVASSCELFYLKSPYFQCSNEINLLDKYATISDGFPVTVLLNSCIHDANPRDVSVEIEYTRTDGIIIFQNTYDGNFEKVLDEVYQAGRCTTLILSFDQPVKDGQLVRSFEYEESDTDVDWIQGLELGDTDEDHSYTIDFTSPELVNYPRYLEYLRLNAKSSDPENALKLYVLAYGFVVKR